MFSKKCQRNLGEVVLNDKRVDCKATSDRAPGLNPDCHQGRTLAREHQ